MTEQDLKNFLVQSATETWEAKAEPYLLSLVADDLKEQGKDYREALGEDERLKGFVKRVEEQEKLFNVVQHPRQTAKIGLVPYGQDFAFPLEKSGQQGVQRQLGKSDREAVLLAFLHSLKGLPDDVLDQIIIPAKAIAYLLGKK